MSKKEISEIMKLLLELKEELQEHKEEFRQNKEDIKPLLELIQGAVVGRRVILYFTSLIIAIVAAYIAIKQLF